MTGVGRLVARSIGPQTDRLRLRSVLATRKPKLLLRFEGSFLLRFAERTLGGLLFQLSPRFTCRE